MKLGLFIFLYSAIVFSANKPSWVNNTQEGCMKMSELCAVGMGTSRDDAKRNAKIEIAKIFSTNISSTFTSSLAGSGQSNEEIQEDIKEETSSVLEGVQVNKVYEQEDAFYVLAVLEKRPAAESMKLKINDLDSEIKVIVEDKENTAKTKLKRLFVKRQGLNQTYLFLTGTEIASPIDSDLIFKSNKTAMKGMVLHVLFQEKDPKPLESAVVKALTEMGYKVTTGTEKNVVATHEVTGVVAAEKQYINIKGFRKYKLILKIAAKNSKKIESGHLNLEATTTGRTFAQAYENALKEISNELKEKINDLNIE
jgi:hypothetical protein